MRTLLTAADAIEPAIFMIQCGINSIGSDADAAWSVLEVTLNENLAAGIRIQPSTIAPTSGTSLEDDFNAHILAWCSTNNIECADPYSLLEATPGSGSCGSGCGVDGLHLTASGALIQASEWHRAGVVNGYW
jgi:hypothetical protein